MAEPVELDASVLQDGVADDVDATVFETPSTVITLPARTSPIESVPLNATPASTEPTANTSDAEKGLEAGIDATIMADTTVKLLEGVAQSSLEVVAEQSLVDTMVSDSKSLQVSEAMPLTSAAPDNHPTIEGTPLVQALPLEPVEQASTMPATVASLAVQSDPATTVAPAAVETVLNVAAQVESQHVPMGNLPEQTPAPIVPSLPVETSTSLPVETSTSLPVETSTSTPAETSPLDTVIMLSPPITALSTGAQPLATPTEPGSVPVDAPASGTAHVATAETGDAAHVASTASADANTTAPATADPAPEAAVTQSVASMPQPIASEAEPTPAQPTLVQPVATVPSTQVATVPATTPHSGETRVVKDEFGRDVTLRVRSPSPPALPKAVPAHTQPQLSAPAPVRHESGPPPLDSRIFVGNLACERTSEAELRQIFGQYGHVLEISMHSSFGFVQFDNPGSAQAAIAGENQKVFAGLKLGRSLSILVIIVTNIMGCLSVANSRTGQCT